MGKRNLKGILVVSILTIMGAAIPFLYQNCGTQTQKIYQAQFPPLGQTVTMKPVAPQKAIKTFHDYKNKLIFFLHEARPLTYDDEFTIQMFSADHPEKPVYEFTPGQLKEMYKTSACPQAVIKYLYNAGTNDALFCNNSLDLRNIKYYKVILKGKVESATSYGLDFVNEGDDIIALEIMFD